MKTLTTPITNTLSIPRLVKYEITSVVDNDDSVPPCLAIRLQVYGPTNLPYGDGVSLLAYDAQASTCLRVKAVQQSTSDLIEVYGAVITGLYTRLSGVYNANVSGVGTKRKRFAALEADLAASGILTSDFAVT
jgi:hypothetical protein